MNNPDKNTWIKLIKGFFPYFATPAMLVVVIWTIATFKAETSQKQFNSIEEKVKTLDHVNSAPNEVDNYKAYQRLDSISKAVEQTQKDNQENKNDAIKSRAKRDSLINKNAVTIFQMKEQQLEQTRITKEILSKLDSI